VSSAQPSGPDRTPGSFPEVTPAGDLAGYKGTIAYALGELTANIKHLSENIRDQSDRIEKLINSTANSFKEQNDEIRTIKDKILIAETQVRSVFYTSRWFLAIAGIIVGLILGHWTRITHIIGLSG
jgi:uncharacterized protein YukE